MPRKKKDEEVEETTASSDETGAESTAIEAAPAGEGEISASSERVGEETSVVDTVIEAAGGAVETVAVAVGKAAATVVSAVTGPTEPPAKKVHKRAEKVGIVASDKMTKTVTVRVDRLVKHPIYRKYVKKRKKFMAHDDLGAKIGDKVKIVETRPLSARKRWRVVEIIQKAEL